jgi:hypothetical protein
MNKKNKEDNLDLYSAVLFEENKNFKINENNKLLMYTNRLVDDFLDNKDYTFKKWNIEHKVNKKKYRSPEFKKDTDLLIAGCSFTYGVGIPKEFMWAEIVAKDLNLSHANLALPGESVVGQVKKIFAYFKEYGHPKFLCAMFPDFGRFLSPQNSKHFVSNSALLNIERKKADNISIENFWDDNFLYTSNLGPWIPDIKFSRSPHKAENVLIPEISHFYSAQFILMLEQYCILAGINFIWSIWDVKNLKIIESIKKEEYTTLINVEMENWNRDFESIEDVYTVNKKRILCHKDLEEKNNEIFHYAMDRGKGLNLSHWGSHRNQHIADIMKDNILKFYK